MKSLAAQSNSGSVDATARGFINTEFLQLRGEIDNIADNTIFNGSALINGNFNQNFQVGILATNTIVTNLTTVDANIAALGIATAAVDTVANATAASALLDTAINNISSYRSTVGSLLSRFEYRGDVINDSIENLSAAQSAIMDVDIAAEQSNLVSKQVLTEAAIAALSQANQMKSSLLSLVR
jgi:flagellin